MERKPPAEAADKAIEDIAQALLAIAYAMPASEKKRFSSTIASNDPQGARKPQSRWANQKTVDVRWDFLRAGQRYSSACYRGNERARRSNRKTVRSEVQEDNLYFAS